MAEIYVIEEDFIKQVSDRIKSRLQSYLTQLENQFSDGIKLLMPKIEMELFNPIEMPSYPAMSIYVPNRRKVREHRIMFRTTVEIKILLVVRGNHGEKKSYRYMAALGVIAESLFCEIGTVEEPEVKYFDPISSGTEWIKISEMTVTIEKYIPAS